MLSIGKVVYTGVLAGVTIGFSFGLLEGLMHLIDSMVFA
jgi:hypothetical protein